MEEQKTISVNVTYHKKMLQLKLDKDLRTMNDVIEYLFEEKRK